MPKQLRYSSWSASVDSAWGFANTGSGIDSAVVYYWGDTTPLSLDAGVTQTLTQYVSTVLEAVDPEPEPEPSGTTAIPTLAEWSLLLMALLLVGIAFGYLRRLEA